MDLLEIINRIEELKQIAEDLRLNYAQPYMKNFKRQYLWSSEQAEQRYNEITSELGQLIIEKHNLEKENKR